MEHLSQKMELIKLEEEKNSVKKTESEVENQLSDLKSKLDNLLVEKETIDQEAADIENKIKKCSQKHEKHKKEIDKNPVNEKDNENKYALIKHEYDQVSSDREIIIEKNMIVEKKIEDMNNEFEIIVYERNKIRSEDEEIEERCKAMRQEFDALSQKSLKHNLPESLLVQLEDIKVAKEGFLEKDKETDDENKHLWSEAHIIKDQMSNISRQSSCLDEDNEEIQKLFNEITGERNKLIEKDKLLNTRYEGIYKDIQTVCDQRIETKIQIDNLDKVLDLESSKDEMVFKDSLMQEDLMLAVKQKEYEDVFEDWKKEKDLIIKDNKDLDYLLDNLMKKFDLLKEKKQMLLDQDGNLETRSKQLKAKFEINQKRKETIIQQFKEKEMLTSKIMLKIDNLELSRKMEVSGEEKEIRIDGETKEEIDDRLNTLLVEFESLKHTKDSLRMRDQKVSETFVLAKSEFDDLSEERNILIKHQTEIETAYDMFKKAFNELKDESLHTKDEENNSKSIQEEIKNLTALKEDVMKKDCSVAKRFEEYDEEIETLENIKRELKTKKEEIEWQTCLLGNEMDSK
eukprot:GFUD01031767.1.p1 GENE.GFUD01031767.1~~GFUD01031767.1.p1  ORF type:complete len:571 (+),score=234.62 GFUD01031767.1:73-1785(+)